VTTELQQTRYDQLIRRVGGIIGPGAKVAEVIPELFPMIDLENVPPELLLLGGTQVCYGGGTVGVVAAQFSRASITNPLASGKIVTVDSMILGSSTGNTTMVWGRDNAVLAGAIDTQVFADTRNPATNFPVAEIKSDTSVTGSTASAHAKITGSNPLIIEPKHGVMILAPGETLMVRNLATNALLTFTFFWRERVALSSELNL